MEQFIPQEDIEAFFQQQSVQRWLELGSDKMNSKPLPVPDWDWGGQ